MIALMVPGSLTREADRAGMPLSVRELLANLASTTKVFVVTETASAAVVAYNAWCMAPHHAGFGGFYAPFPGGPPAAVGGDGCLGSGASFGGGRVVPSRRTTGGTGIGAATGGGGRGASVGVG